MKRFGEAVKDFIWPRRCEICGLSVDRPGRYLCSECLMRLPFFPTDGLCRVCGREAVGLKGEFLCKECRRHRKNYDRAASALQFEDEVKKLVHSFKSGCAVYLRDDFCDIMEGVVRSRFRLDLITAVTSVPLTIRHRFLRGYDQCAIIAKELSRRIGRPYFPLLKRCGFPKRQAGLSEEERVENVKGTFAVRDALRLKLGEIAKPLVLIVDDVMTTGSTLDECAKTLKHAGVGAVWTVALSATRKD